MHSLERWEPTPLDHAVPGVVAAQAAEDEDGIGSVLWRRRWIVAGIVLMSLLSGGAYLLLAVPLYMAQTRIYLAPISSSILPASAGENRLPENYLRTQCEVIRSRPILQDALRRMGPMDWGEGDPVDDLQESLVVEPGRRDDIITVSLRHAVPKTAEDLVRAVADAYLFHQSRETQEVAAKVLSALRAQQKQRETAMDSKQEQMLDFQRNNAELSFEGERGNVIIERLSRLSEALTTAQQRRVDVEANYGAAIQATSTPEGMSRLIESLQTQGSNAADPEYAELQRQLHAVEINARATEGRVGVAHPSARAAQQAMEALKKRIAEKQERFAAAHLAMLLQQRDAARRNEAELQGMFSEQYKQAVTLNTKVADRARIRADLARLERGNDLLDTRVMDLGTLERTGTINVSIIEAAHVGKKPVSPKAGTVMGGASLAGLLAGFLAALLWDRLDQGFQSPQQISSSLQISVVAAIPHEHGRPGVATGGRLVHLQPQSPAAESYRFLRSSVEASLAQTNGKVLLVTSTLAGEGKTTVAANLALSLAEVGRRVLLVDGDQRKPSQDVVFGLAGAGLSDVLSGLAAWQQVLQNSGVAGLDVITAGRLAANPSALLHNRRLPTVLKEVQSQYDVVVVDSPPAGLVSDTQLLGTLCDATLLVLRTRVTTREMCQYACARLEREGARLIGVVVNDVSRQSLYGGYGYGDSYQVGEQRRPALGMRPVGDDLQVQSI